MFVARANEYKCKLLIVVTHEPEQTAPIVVTPVLTRNLSAKIDRNEWPASERCQCGIRPSNFACREPQIPHRWIVKIDRAKRGKTANEPLCLRFNFTGCSIDAWQVFSVKR